MMTTGFDIHRRVRKVSVPVFGMLFVCYFAVHMFHGDRSIFTWIQLHKDVEAAEQVRDDMLNVRRDLEARISRLRSDDVDQDMLEERARVVTGLAYPDEYILIEENGTTP